VWPGPISLPASSSPPTAATASATPGLHIETPTSPSVTAALSGLVGQNYMQLLQALQQQQQQHGECVNRGKRS
jgi:hypothetical protein